MTDDPLAKWRKPGSPPITPPKDRMAVVPPSGIRPREYKAFVTDASRASMLLLKRGLVKKAEADVAFSYGYLASANSDGYGFGFSLFFARPAPLGSVIVEIRGEGLSPLLDGILNGTVRSVQQFDPDRFLPPKEGDFDIEADEWRGPCVVRDISIMEQGDPLPNTTKH